MSIPKEPRQQMINMMYLFLTAMLALNVSAEILRAFKIVNDSLESTTSIIRNKNVKMYEQFDKNYKDNPEKVGPFRENAQKVKALSQNLMNYLTELKDMIIDAGGNNNGEVDAGDYAEYAEGEKRLKGESNIDIPSQKLLVEGRGKRGKKLKAIINQTRKDLLEFIDEIDKENFSASFPLAKAVDDATKTWQQSNFGEVPLAAAVTLLSKYESDVRNSEAELLNYLLSRISAKDYKFDALTPIVDAKTDYVLSGSKYQAKILMAAYSTTQNPEIIINASVDSVTNKLIFDPEDTIMVPVKEGMGYFTTQASGIGPKTYKGIIKMRKPDGACCDYHPFTVEYFVSSGGAVVSPTKMNVLYIGLDNPLAISAAGFTNDRVTANISGGSGRLKRGRRGGEWIAQVRKTGKAKINVIAKMDDGSSKRVGAQEFRVKRVPDPIAKVGGKAGGKIQTSQFKPQKGIIAVLENFNFDVRFRIISYEMIFIPRRQDALVASGKGEKFNSQMKLFLSRAKPGDKFFFGEIKAKGPDGTTRKLPSVAFDLL